MTALVRTGTWSGRPAPRRGREGTPRCPHTRDVPTPRWPRALGLQQTRFSPPRQKEVVFDGSLPKTASPPVGFPSRTRGSRSARNGREAAPSAQWAQLSPSPASGRTPARRQRRLPHRAAAARARNRPLEREAIVLLKTGLCKGCSCIVPKLKKPTTLSNQLAQASARATKHNYITPKRDVKISCFQYSWF